MCPLEGAPRFLQNPGLLSAVNPGTGCHNTGFGFQTLWKEKFRGPELTSGKEKYWIVKLIIISLFSSYVFN